MVLLRENIPSQEVLIIAKLLGRDSHLKNKKRKEKMR